MSFHKTFKDKKVLITGHTGFKGSWLTTWMLDFGAQIVGFSCDIPTEPSLFKTLQLESKIKHVIGDLTDLSVLKSVIQKEKPDFIFHLGAQAIVAKSYSDPMRTLQSNVMGTANVLEALREVDWNCTAVLITSDKCYENVEWVWGYKETDTLGGKDIYSASKAAAEIIIQSYFASFMSEKKNIRIARARAGNVIGGGDWAQDRIVADTMRAWFANKTVTLRNPNATRPWQHVLEPLSGYLHLAHTLSMDSRYSGEAYNFGPKSEQNRSVQELISDLSQTWPDPKAARIESLSKNTNNFYEAGLLKLNCDKALLQLQWQATLNYKQTVAFVGEWYAKSFENKDDLYQFTKKQIANYTNYAKELGLTWAIQ